MSASEAKSVSKPSAAPKKGTGKKGGILKKLLSYCLPWAITVSMVIWTFHNVDAKRLWEIITKQSDVWWLAAGMVVFTTAALVFRGVRWEMQVRQAGGTPAPMAVGSMAIFGAYALNLLFPRLGEAWRCWYVSKRQKCPFMTVVGTDVGDRTADLIVVFLLIVLALLLTPTAMAQFFHRFAVGRVALDFFGSPWTWTVVILLIMFCWSCLHFGNGHKWAEAINRALRNIGAGFMSLFRLRPMGVYLWLTLGLWVCNYLQTYLCLFGFPFTQHIVHDPGSIFGLGAGLVILVLGSCSTIIPSNGGLGPWTIGVAYALEVYGVQHTDATAFALAAWCIQAITLVILGIIAAFYTRKLRDGDATPQTTVPNR